MIQSTLLDVRKKTKAQSTILINGIEVSQRINVTSRRIFHYKDREQKINLIIKVDNKMTQSEKEINLWNNQILRSDRRHFVPIFQWGTLEDGRGWVAQPYMIWDWIDSIEKVPKSIYKKVNALSYRYDLCDISAYLPTPKEGIYWRPNGNWDIYHGCPMIYDYGV